MSISVAENSIFVRFFLALWAVLRDGWAGSVLSQIFTRIGLALQNTVEGSSFFQFLWRDGVLVRGWPCSLACEGFTAVINLPVALVQWIYGKGKKIFDGSFAFRFGTTLGGSSYIFVGLSMLSMLIVPHDSWNNSYMLLCMYGVTLLFLAGCAARRRWRLELDTLGPYFTLFAGFIVYGLIASLSTSLSIRFFIFYVIAFLITLYTVSAVHRVEELQLVAVIAAAGLTVAALYGCYQGVVGVPVVANQQDILLNKNMPGRVYSFFDNPNNFAEVLVMLMPLLLGLLLNAKTWRGKLLAALALIPCVGSIGFTYSRSGWIGLAIALAVFLVLLNWRFLPAFLVLGAMAIHFLPESIIKRILTIGNMEDSSTRYRFAIYGNSRYLIQDYGARGVGLGTDVMREVFKVYPTMFDGHYPIHTHNNYLQMLGELGLFGAVAYLALVVGQVKRGVKAFYSGRDRAAKNLLAAAIGSFCGILVIGVAEYTWFYPRNLFVWWFLFAIITACVKLLKNKTD
jgi:putative inorganic carbon (HCO3(-)) transporter